MSIKIWVAGDQALAADINENFKETAYTLPTFAVATGSANAYVVNLPLDIGALTAGMRFSFQANFTNTGPATINPDTLGALSIRKNGSALLDAGDIQNGQIVLVEYDGTTCQLLSNPSTYLRGFQLGWVKQITGSGNYGDNGICGFSDATTPLITLASYGGPGDSALITKAEVASDIGVEIYSAVVFESQGNANSPGVYGAEYIGTDLFESTSAGTIKKNGSAVSFSGTARNGPLGHNGTSSLLLVLYSTTKIAQFSGIAGTTLTNTGDITLDTAITQSVGFLYDKTNARYICVDKTANVLRRFNSAGVTIDTVAYTFDDTLLAGICVIAGRVHAVIITGGGTSGSANDTASAHATFIPTNMTI